MSSQRRQVVISGLGAISPLGNTPELLWDALMAGQSGVGPLSAVPRGTFPMDFAAEATDFHGKIDDFGSLEKEQKKAIRKGLKVMCRESQMGVAVAQRALAHAGLKPGSYDPLRAGVNFGVDYMLTVPEEFRDGVVQCLGDQEDFEFARWPSQGMPKMSPLWLLKYLPNMPASHIAIYNDMRGPSNSITLREASANLSVGEAFHIIVSDRADIILAGATGTRLHPMKTIHAVQQEELATTNGDPTRACRPFDLNRSGMVLGEGAGAVVLETLSSAEARGATIYAEVVARGSSGVAGRGLLARGDLATKNALAAVLAAANVAPEDVGHLHAHGLSTRSGDAEEAWAIDQIFGSRETPIPVVAAKSYFGNLGAGSGIVELVASVLALNRDCLFPILNYQTPDPACPITAVTDGQTSPGASFINLNVTPQGQASAVMVRRVE